MITRQMWCGARESARSRVRPRMLCYHTDHMAPSATIAHITAPAAFGGLERVVSGLARALAAAGHRILLVTVLEPESPLPAWAEQLTDARITLVPVRVRPRAYAVERAMLRDILRAHRVDVVHTHGYRADVIDGGAALAAGYPVVSTVHGFTRYGLRNQAYEWLQVRALRKFSAVVAVSQPLATELQHRGIAPERMAIIPNGVVAPLQPLLDRKAARERLGLAPDAPIVGWIGRLSHEKGPDVMVRAAALLRASGASVCFIGDGPMLAECRALAASTGIADRVRFAGVVPDAAILCRAFDVFALSSRTEGTPMALLEAIVAGVPVAATAVGGVPDVFGADHAGLVRSEDPAALAGALDTILADPASSTLRADGLRARVTSSGGEGRWTARYSALYRELLAAAGGGTGGRPHQNSSVR